MKLLPPFITTQYPCILTKKKGVSKELMDLIEELAVEIPMAKLHSILQLLYGKRYTTSHLQFLTYLQYIKRANSLHRFSRSWSEPPTPFPNQSTACIGAPSRQYISQVFIARSENRRQFMDNQMASITGRTLLFDHTFKIAKYLRQYGASDRLFEAVGTVMNEYGQILTQVFTPTTANTCIQHMLKHLKKRQDQVGCAVDCIYVDNCCKIRGFLTDIFGSSTVVLLDVYHLMDRILRTLSKLCPYYTHFARDLSDCIFQVNEDDVIAAKTKLFQRSQQYPNRRIHGVRLADINPNNPPRHFLKRTCRYMVRAIPDIKSRLDILLDKYISFPSFPLPQRTITMVRNQFNNHIAKKCIDDPYPLEDMYIVRPGQIYQYHAKRGTSIMENYHGRIRVILSGTCAGTSLVDTLVREYNYRHNQKAGWRNLQLPITIHFDLQELDQLNQLHSSLFPNTNLPYDLNISTSTTQTEEQFGVRGAAAAMKRILGLLDKTETLNESNESDEDENEDEDEEEESDLSDISSVQSSDRNDSDVDDDTDSEPVYMTYKLPSIVLDPPPQDTSTHSAAIAASMMGIQRPIVPVVNQTEARVIQNLVHSVGTNFKRIAPAFNAIAQESSSMMFKTPQHIQAFMNMNATTSMSNTITSSSKIKAPSRRGGDRKSKKFKESTMNNNQNKT